MLEREGGREGGERERQKEERRGCDSQKEGALFSHIAAFSSL